MSKEETKKPAAKKPAAKPEEKKKPGLQAVKRELINSSVYEKLQNARADFAAAEVKKGGENEYAKFKYFELNDILPVANRILKENRITPVFNIWETEAELVIYDFDNEETITFRTDNADATMLNKNGKPINLEIQTIGSQHSYLKRYLYMNALEIAETDTIEQNTDNPDYTPNVPKRKAAKQKTPAAKPLELATTEQLEYAREIFTKERIDRMLELVNPPLEKLEDMPKEILHDVIIKEQKAKQKAQEAERERQAANEEPNTSKKRAPSLDDII